MARFVVKNGPHTHMFHDEIGLHAQNLSSILGSIVNKIGKISAISSKRMTKICFDLPQFLQIISNSETWIDNLHNSQLLTGWENFPLIPGSKQYVGLEVPTIGSYTVGGPELTPKKNNLGYVPTSF